jgi:hypothetical protein
MWRTAFSIAESVHVNVQLSKGTNESVAVDSQHAGGFALIPISVSEDGKNKLLPKFFECFEIEYACPVHPQHQRLELRLRGVRVFSCHLGSGKGFVSRSWRSLSQSSREETEIVSPDFVPLPGGLVNRIRMVQLWALSTSQRAVLSQCEILRTASFVFDGSIGSLIENAAHLTVALG